MNNIRIKNNIKKIEVNDDGDYITINFNDRSIPSKFYSLTEKFEEKRTEAEKKLADIIKIENENQKARALFDLDLEIHNWLSKEVDNIFGEDTCKKVFGDIVPNIYLYIEFFEQITPYFADYVNFQKELTTKYSPNRTGNV